MKSTAAFLTSLLLAATGAEAKPLKVFILAGQSNMEGHARVETLDYLRKYKAELISPAEAAKWATRRVQRRLPLPRLRQNLRPHGQGVRRSQPGDDEGAEWPVSRHLFPPNL